jgi:hypothetical protein
MTENTEDDWRSKTPPIDLIAPPMLPTIPDIATLLG